MNGEQAVVRVEIGCKVGERIGHRDRGTNNDMVALKQRVCFVSREEELVGR